MVTNDTERQEGNIRDKRYSLERYSQVASEWRRPFCIRAFMATLPR